MAKAKRVANVKVGYRMQETVVAMVSNLAEKCGWTESRAAAFLIDVGSAAVGSSDAGKLRAVVDDAKASQTAAAALAAAANKAAKLVSDAKAEFNAAERKRRGEPNAPKVLESVPNTAKAVRRADKAATKKGTPAPTTSPSTTPPDVEGQKKIHEILKV